jgi:hypothetical protein
MSNEQIIRINKSKRMVWVSKRIETRWHDDAGNKLKSPRIKVTGNDTYVRAKHGPIGRELEALQSASK